MNETIEMPSCKETINDLEPLLQNFLKDICDCESLFGDILITIMEAVHNAISHGNRYDTEKKVTIHMLASDSRVEFTVCDEGEGFNLEDHLPNPTSDEIIADCNGRGVFLMKSLSHDLEYADQGRKVKLCFELNKSVA